MIASRILRRLLLEARRRVEPKLRRGGFPYQTYIADFGDLLKFEVHNLTDAYRVEFHGNETDYLRRLVHLLLPSDVLWDVGASVGLFTIQASMLCKHVVAFEPDPAFRNKLRTNLALNKRTNVTVVPTAIADVAGHATLWTDGISNWSPSLARQRGEEQSLSVRTETLDTSLANHPSPTVLKIDIEGAEIMALRGGQSLFTGKDRPRLLFLEIHPTFLLGFEATAEDIEQMLGQYGYGRTWSIEREDQQLCVYEPQSIQPKGRLEREC